MIHVADVTHILQSLQAGEPQAADELLPLVYAELRRLAAGKMSHEKPGQTLDATALVHEAYVRLLGPGETGCARFANRRHFFASAAEAMRRILVENARRKKRTRHGGKLKRADVDVNLVAGPSSDDELLALDTALEKLALEDPVKAQLIQLRFFAGLSNEEAAAALEISTATAKRYWRYARAWLHREIGGAAH